MSSAAPRATGYVASFLSISFLLAGIPSSTRAQGSSIRMETFAFRPNGQVRIENLRGATRVEVWDDQSVHVVAQKRAPAGKALDSSELMMMGTDNTLFIQCRQTGRPDQVDLDIYVPRLSHLQVTGGAWPVNVNGSLGSATVETTSGNIGYRVPPSEGARVAMHSARGVVRTNLPITVSERAGLRSLQGRLGNGGTPIILNSQSGNITLLPGSKTTTASVIDETTIMSGGARVGSSRQDPDPGAYRRPPADDQWKSSTRDPVDDPDDPNSISTPPSQRGQVPSAGYPSSGGSSNNSISLGGHKGGRDKSVESRRGPLSQSRTVTDDSEGSLGLSVRIIPSTTPAGSSGDPRYSNRRPNPIYDEIVPDPSSRSSSAPDRAGQPDPTRSQPFPDAAPIDPDVPANKRPDKPPVLGRASDKESSGAMSNGGADDTGITLESALVSLNVSVTDRAGLALPQLKKDDFQIYENGAAQEVEFFAASNAPFNLVLLLDLSGSIKDKIDVVKSAALRFLEVVGPQDKVAVVTFTRQVRVISQLTNDRDVLRKRVKAIDETDEGTAFYEALWFAVADTLRGTKGQRNAVVVMTDGVDNSLERSNGIASRVSFERLGGLLEESDVIVFPVYLDTEYEEVFERRHSSSEAYALARYQLERMADVTGGRLFKARDAKDLSGIYGQVAAALRTVYSVGYYPSNAEKDGTFRRVNIRVNKPEAVVRSRKGYYAN